MATDYLGRTISAGEKYAVVGEVRAIDSPRSGMVCLVAGSTPIHCHAADIVHVDSLAPRKWVERFFRSITGSTTGFGLAMNGTLSTVYGVPVRTKQIISGVAVLAQHFNGSAPSDWTLRLRKNGSGSDLATFDFSWDPDDNDILVSTGDFSTPVTMSEGDQWALYADGPSIGSPRLMITVEAEEDPS